jgi:hypothetical protein
MNTRIPPIPRAITVLDRSLSTGEMVVGALPSDDCIRIVISDDIEALDLEQEVPGRMAYITQDLGPAELRQISAWLNRQADRLDKFDNSVPMTRGAF